jgi:hypothetical protein
MNESKSVVHFIGHYVFPLEMSGTQSRETVLQSYENVPEWSFCIKKGKNSQAAGSSHPLATETGAGLKLGWEEIEKHLNRKKAVLGGAFCHPSYCGKPKIGES